ncbi:nucleotidyltransferase family protein [Magnetovibrio sp.]|uniref:nucleotidyltransferase family protein n=1 Tax=Magnetovibrio sp. TaxID=2024836 RepID=UPI002F95E548
MRPKSAMVLAAGLGLRMRPLTDHRPKPMIEVAGQTLIDWALTRIADAGVSRAVVNLHYLGEQIQAHLKDRTAPTISFSPEDPILETGGGIERALAELGTEPFFACNSDGLWLDGQQNALTRLADMWDDDTMDGVLLLHDPAQAMSYDGPGDFTIASNGQLTRRTDDPANKAYVFTGVQLLHPRLFTDTPGGAYSLNVLYDRALAAGRLYGLVHDGAWFHVGTPEARDATEAWLIEHGLGQ